jgi:hypothetical protein
MNTDKLLTFELSKKRNELFVVGDANGLRFLATKLTRLAEKLDRGQSDHEHLMTEEWAGHELSSVPQGQGTELLNQVTIYARKDIKSDA